MLIAPPGFWPNILTGVLEAPIKYIIMMIGTPDIILAPTSP